MKTLKEQVKELVGQLETKDGKVTCFEGKLLDAIQSMHDGHLPTNWIFDTTLSLIDSLSQYDFETLEDLEDVRHEIVDGCIDIYHHDLLEWQKQFSEYTEQASDEGLIGESSDISAQIQAGQFMKIDSMFCEIISLLEEE